MFGAGVITDRFSRKTVLVAAQVLLMVQALLLGVLTVSGLLSYWMLFFQSMVEGVSVAFLVPSRQAMTGQLLGAHGVGRGVILQQGAMGVGRIFGPDQRRRAGRHVHRRRAASSCSSPPATASPRG